jgi:hypothetical protein
MYWSARTVAEWVADNPDDLDALRRMGRNSMVQALKETPWTKRDTAAIRGTDIHALADRIAHGDEVDVPDHHLAPLQGYVAWLDAWHPQVIWTERPCASRKWQIAGTADVVCTINDETWLIDWKTSAGVYGDNALQVAAYGHCEFYVDTEGNEQPMPHIDRYGIVHIQPGETQLYEVTDPEAAWKDFLHVAWTANAKDRISNYLQLREVA